MKFATLITRFYKKFDIYIVVTGVLLIGGLLQFYEVQTIKNQRQTISILSSNIKSYENEFNEHKTSSQTLKLTIDQLETSNDSLIQKMDSIRKAKGIKGKTITNISTVVQVISDTIYDTIPKIIFQKDTFCYTFQKHKDTKVTICRKDSVFSCIPEISNEQTLITYNKKEYIRSYKSYFRRLLKFDFRKQSILTIDVVNSNKDLTIKQSRFIEIIR